MTLNLQVEKKSNAYDRLGLSDKPLIDQPRAVIFKTQAIGVGGTLRAAHKPAHGSEIQRDARALIRRIPANRHEEMFTDFEQAITSRDVNLLADSISNWIQGGHGYSHAGIKVNKKKLPNFRSEPGLSEALDNLMKQRESDGDI